MGRAVGGIFSSIALAAAMAGCEEPVPKTPTFAVDVAPLFLARCVRCHGAGGSLNADPRAYEKSPPPDGYLDHYDDQGDCALDATGRLPASCRHGARYEADNGNLHIYIHLPPPDRMPMVPADPLTSWELELVDNWLAESPPMP